MLCYFSEHEISEHHLRRKAKKQQQRRLRLLDRATEDNGGKIRFYNIECKNKSR